MNTVYAFIIFSVLSTGPTPPVVDMSRVFTSPKACSLALPAIEKGMQKRVVGKRYSKKSTTTITKLYLKCVQVMGWSQ